MKHALRLLAVCALAFATALPAHAVGLIRDAEIERALRELARPVLRAAGLPQSIRILVVDDRRMNAFVMDARHIFVTSGLIMRLDDPDQLQAVLAHEAAHIANGHLARRAANIDRASTAARIGLALAIATAAAGNADAGFGLAAGTTSSAMRRFFAHTRAEESSADQSALRYMVQAGIDPRAMVEVLDLFRGQEVLSAGRQDPYVLTHPLSRDRIRAVEAFANGRSGAEPSAEARYWWARLTGKLSAFLRAPGWTLRQVGRNDTSEIAHLRRAIAYHRQPNANRALAEIQALIGLRPNDPYYTELQGQILYESRRFDTAVQAYARAAQLAPGEPLILAGYGRALLALETAQGNAEALRVLERARDRDPYDARMLRDLAVAYARLGQTGMASVVTAERYAMNGRMEDAEVHATRAVGLLPTGSPGWLRAQDIVTAAARD